MRRDCYGVTGTHSCWCLLHAVLTFRGGSQLFTQFLVVWSQVDGFQHHSHSGKLAPAPSVECFLTAELLGTYCDVHTLTVYEVTLNQRTRMWRFLVCSYKTQGEAEFLFKSLWGDNAFVLITSYAIAIHLQSFITIILWHISIQYVWRVL